MYSGEFANDSNYIYHKADTKKQNWITRVTYKAVDIY